MSPSFAPAGLRRVSPSLPKPFVGEGVAGAGFQVELEGGGLAGIAESDVGAELPRREFGGVGGFAGIVFREAALEIGRAPDVALARVAQAVD